jgi:hypothetical protein
MEAVPILYGMLAFGAFDDFGVFVKSINYGTSEACQQCGANPCRGATNIARTFSPRYLTEHWQFHAFTPDSDRLRYRRSPEFQGLEPETAVILRFSILGTPLFNSRLWLIGPG